MQRNSKLITACLVAYTHALQVEHDIQAAKQIRLAQHKAPRASQMAQQYWNDYGDYGDYGEDDMPDYDENTCDYRWKDDDGNLVVCKDLENEEEQEWCEWEENYYEENCADKDGGDQDGDEEKEDGDDMDPPMPDPDEDGDEKDGDDFDPFPEPDEDGDEKDGDDYDPPMPDPDNDEQQCDYRWRDDDGNIVNCDDLENEEDQEWCKWEEEYYEENCADKDGGDKDGDEEKDDGDDMDPPIPDPDEGDEEKDGDEDDYMPDPDNCDYRWRDDDGNLVVCEELDNEDEQEWCQQEVEFYEENCADKDGDEEKDDGDDMDPPMPDPDEDGEGQNAKELLQQYDTNGDGALSLNEFEEFLKAMEFDGGDEEKDDGDDYDPFPEPDEDGDEEKDGDDYDPPMPDPDNDEQQCDYRWRDDDGNIVNCDDLENEEDQEWCKWEEEYYEENCADGEGDKDGDEEKDDGDDMDPPMPDPDEGDEEKDGDDDGQWFPSKEEFMEWFDMDQDGCFSLDEFEMLFMSYCTTCTEYKSAKGMFFKFDTGKDGKLCADEFSEVYEYIKNIDFDEGDGDMSTL